MGTRNVIFDKYVHHNKSFYRIAMDLNDKGIVTKNGNPFNTRSVRYILDNPIMVI